MSEAASNSYVYIYSNGDLSCFDANGVRIKELTGDLTMLHTILKINKMVSRDKAKLPSKMRLRSTTFNFVREDTSDIIPIPIQHITAFADNVKEGNTTEFLEDLIMQIQK